jgi:Fe-S oxidoreductase
MAGTFGYEAEHYQLSQQVGELKLFPYIRRLRTAEAESPPVNPQSQIVYQKSKIASTGAACRLQIEQGTGVQAEHPIVLVARALRRGIPGSS